MGPASAWTGDENMASSRKRGNASVEATVDGGSNGIWGVGWGGVGESQITRDCGLEPVLCPKGTGEPRKDSG